MTWILTLFVILGVLTPWVAAQGREPAPNWIADGAPIGGDPISCAGPNLLTNPSFEGEYSAYIPPDGHPDCDAGICGTAQMAPGWTPWWRSHDPADDPWIIRMPEYKPASAIFDNPPRVRTGEAAQQYFTFFSTHEAGFLQNVSVVPGVEYCFSIWGHAWSADDDSDALSGPEFGNFNMRVGIDPSGVSDWPDGPVVWSGMRFQYDYFDVFRVETQAQAYNLTVFTYSNPEYPVKHNDAYWDDAHLSPIWLRPLPTVVSLQTVGNGFADQRTVYVNLSGRTDLTWTAAVAGGDVPVQIVTANNGGVGDNFVVEVDGTGFPPGVYTRDITITASEPINGSPATVTVILSVVDDIAQVYMPTVSTP